MSEPKWLAEARALVGLKEIVGSRHEKKVVQFFADAGHAWVKDDETAWCAAFVNAMLAKAGVKGTGSLAARSFLKWGEKLKAPKPGCIVVFKRGNSSWQGHVAFFIRTVGASIEVLGGNQGNAVSIAKYPKSKLLGYRWPAQGAGSSSSRSPADAGSSPLVPVPDESVAIEAERVLDDLDSAATVERRVREGQTILAALGYPPGGIDGDYGTLTAGALFAFKSDWNAAHPERAAALATRLDDYDLALLREAERTGFKRGLSPVRTEITAREMRAESVTVKASGNNKWWAWLLGIPGAVTAALTGVKDSLGDAADQVAPVVGFFGDIPGWVYGVGIAGVAFLIWRNSRKAEDDTVAAKREARLL